MNDFIRDAITKGVVEHFSKDFNYADKLLSDLDAPNINLKKVLEIKQYAAKRGREQSLPLELYRKYGEVASKAEGKERELAVKEATELESHIMSALDAGDVEKKRVLWKQAAKFLKANASMLNKEHKKKLVDLHDRLGKSAGVGFWTRFFDKVGR